ncbi:MAG: PEP-CTERM sorting domain-containing protein [Verrucomicrobiaceae bacterium]
MIYLRHLFFGLTLAVFATGAVRANDLFNNNPLPGSLIDLSDDGNAPTFLTFSDGHNIVEGSMGWDGFTLDADIWTFTVAAGYEVSEIRLVSYNGSNPVAPNGHWMALAAGNTIDTTQSVNHLSNALWTEETDGLGNSNTNLLALLQNGPEFGGIGFSGNLQAGDYTFWVQEASSFVNQYCIDFVITPVPEPGSALLMGMASFLCLRRRRPRK